MLILNIAEFRSRSGAGGPGARNSGCCLERVITSADILTETCDTEVERCGRVRLYEAEGITSL